MIACSRFQTCEAAICPLDKERGKRWFPDTPVCKRQNSKTFTVPQWLITQRKIAKKKLAFEAGYFTVNMMDRNIRVFGGIRGLNPDKPLSTEAKDVKAWIAKHPEIVVTEAMRERGKRLHNRF